MAKKKAKKNVASLSHKEARRKNIPTAEYQSVMKKDEQSPIRAAYKRRNRDLDPQLVWRGKDEKDLADLEVQAPPLYIQEKVHPKVLIDDLIRRTEKAAKKDVPQQMDLFADFNGINSEAAKTEFYRHDANWANRMILGDSLQVMTSLAEREGLRGKVQCVYLDPPYGIRFNSNFQWSTTSRDVKDGNRTHITREPEQVKAFRDTWRDGIHSYLSYLRNRLTVTRDLLTDSGSIFVQIGDENVHRVRCLMDEVFGEENFVSTIAYAKTTGFSSETLSNVADYMVWYTRKRDCVKYRDLFTKKQAGEIGATKYREVSSINALKNSCHEPIRLATSDQLTSQGESSNRQEFVFMGQKWGAPKGLHWKTTVDGIHRAIKAERVIMEGSTPRYARFLDDFAINPRTNIWLDIGGVQSRTDPKVYVVQTATEAVARCMLMTTDPGDLVLDPTCGSGTTAYVAEQWGRRWITIDTSRVSLALARARIMGAKYDYYLLADSPEGQAKEAELSGKWSAASDQKAEKTGRSSRSAQHYSLRQGFVYERVPHITLKSIANNANIDVIWEEAETSLVPLREALTRAIGSDWLTDYRADKNYDVDLPNVIQEWEAPREFPDDWPESARELHQQFWRQRIARQQEIDADIAARADFEYLYDKPYKDNKTVRVAGPFTVESLSPHRVLGLDENDELIDTAAETKGEFGEARSFVPMILENLKTHGVQQAHKEDKIDFTVLTPWPGDLICAEGRCNSDKWAVDSGRSTAKHKSPATTPGKELRAGIYIGPEFGTVSRPDLVAAAREAGDADFDLLIACAFNYDAHSTEFEKLGRIPVLKARMNADLHMAEDLKNTGKGNLFVIFGEPDVEVISGRWLVTRDGTGVVNYEQCKELSGLGNLEEINALGGSDLSRFKDLSGGREIRPHEPDSKSRDIDTGKHRGRGGASGNQGVSAVSERSRRVTGRDGDISDYGKAASNPGERADPAAIGALRRDQPHARRPKAVAAIKNLKQSDFPLSLTTGHLTQVTVRGVDVFHPATGEVRSDGPDGIACWFIDTDYNEESFFVRHAYFLGANDPYKSLKTTLKAEINRDAWETLKSDTSRPFDKPESGRIAVKVINHLGDEVMKVFGV